MCDMLYLVDVRVYYVFKKRLNTTGPTFQG